MILMTILNKFASFTTTSRKIGNYFLVAKEYTYD
jgi:hypothetical protein